MITIIVIISTDMILITWSSNDSTWHLWSVRHSRSQHVETRRAGCSPSQSSLIVTIIDEGEDEDDEDDEDDEGINYDDEEEEVLGDNDKYIINDEGVSDCDKKKFNCSS